MNSPTTLKEPGAEASRRTLEQLFVEAETYGAIHVYSNAKKRPPNRYHVSIDFNTIPGVSMEAKSDFGLPIEAAFEEAIAKAKQIAGQFK